MGLMREQATLLFILFAIGFTAHNANGVCYKPVFTNPYAITVEPNQTTYKDYDIIELSCEGGHTSYGLPEGPVYCYPDGSWFRDPSAGLCYAQCNTTALIEDDDVKSTNDSDSGVEKKVFDHGENAYFECADKGQFAGSAVGTCDNGTLSVGSDPSCLAFCPVRVDEDGMIGDGLYYDIADDPELNENTTIYYGNDDRITYRCLDGYDGPQNCSASDCKSTCVDGSWDPDPPEIPVCVGQNSNNATIQTPSQISTDVTRSSARLSTTMSYDFTTITLRMSTTEIDECSSELCKNNATCEDQINGYLCHCAVGFNGTNCEENINDCLGHACQNGGTCVDKIDSYECQCPDGFNGDLCQNEMTTMVMMTTAENVTATESGLTTVTDNVTITTSGMTTSITGATTVTLDVTTVSVTSDATTMTTVTPDTSTVMSDATTVNADVTTVIFDVTTITPDVTTAMIVTSDVTSVTADVTTVTPRITTVIPDTTPSLPDTSTVISDVSTVFSDASTTISDASTTISDASTVILDVTTVSVTSDASTVTPDTSTVTSDATTVNADVTTVIFDVTTITPDVTSAMTVTSDVTSVTSDVTTVTPRITTVIPDTSTSLPDTSTVISDVSTVFSDASTTISDASTVILGTSTTTPDASTAISDGTSHIPTTNQATTVSSTTIPGITTSAIALSETPEASSVQSTSPLAKETTTTAQTTPQRTEKPHTTPLPCKGECLATQVCNVIRNNTCECRSGYYEDETDSEILCKEPVSIDVTLRITKVNGAAANFTEELNNSTSKEFKELESEVCQPFNEIYANDTEFVGCQVLEFREGSIVVNYILKFAENSTQNPSTVNQTIQDDLANPNGSFADEFTIDPDSLAVEPLNECNKTLDDCDENAKCIDEDEKGYTCECNPGYEDSVGSLRGRNCIERTPTEPQTTEPQPTKPKTTKEPEEPGLVPWKVIVGVTVPIVGILTISTIGLTCWQYRRQHRTSPSPSKKLNTFAYDYEEDKRDSSDRESGRPGSMRIINSDGTVQEVVLPWRNFAPEAEFVFGQDNNKRETQLLPMVDYSNEYSGSTSDENDPMRNIHGAFDNYTYEYHDTRKNATEIDHSNFF